MRGGTLLHKVHLAPAARYSEDIDLVIYGARPGSHIEKAIKRVLKAAFGDPADSLWDKIQLAIRNRAKPSRVLRLTYSIPSVSEPGTNLDIVVEANATERNPHRKILKIPFEFKYRDSSTKASLNGYDLHEMLGTKMRALFQRRRGRDLFDLFWALTRASPAADPALVVDSFRHYLGKEGRKARRGEYIDVLDGHLANRGFCSDMVPLLRAGLTYNPQEAGVFVKEKLLGLLPR